MNTEDVLERVKKGEGITWDDVRELPEEELKKVLLHVIKTDAELQEALAGWLAAFYKGMARFGPASQGLTTLLESKLARSPGIGCGGCGAIAEGTPENLPPGWKIRRHRGGHDYRCPNCQKKPKKASV